MKASFIHSALAVLVASAAVQAAPAAVPQDADAGNLIPHRYVIEFADPQDGLLPAGQLEETLSLNDLGASITYKINNQFFSGVTVQFQNADDIERVKALPNVKSTRPVRLVPRPKPAAIFGEKNPGPSPQDYAAHGMTGVLETQNQLGYYGKGVKVAVLDTGVYYKHPALGGCFGAGCKVVTGWDFAGDAYVGDNTPVPDNDPMDDCSDSAHGTHVAGIIAANATGMTGAEWTPVVPFTGVAPQAQIGAYRVFGCAGSAGDDVIADAIFKAYEDGMDIINMSLGGGAPFPDSISTLAAEMVAQRGVYVLASAGNDGAAGMFTTGPPAVARSVWSIASIDNSKMAAFNFMDEEKNNYPYSPSSAGGGFHGETNVIVLNNPDADPQTTTDDGCKPLTKDVKGKFVMFQNGADCGSGARCTNAKNAGAVGCIVYANTPGTINILGAVGIPGAGVDDIAAAKVKAIIKANPAHKFTFTDKIVVSDVPTGKTPSSFTSYGLDGLLNMKPELAGIGGNVYSTISEHSAKKNGMPSRYISMSGTSMSCPYVAGQAALFIEARGKVHPDIAKAYFQNNAKPVLRSNDADNNGKLASVASQGAGLVNIFDTVTAKTLVYPSRLALNDTTNHKSVNRLTIKNNFSHPATYVLSDIAAITSSPSKKGNDRPLIKPTESSGADAKATVSFSVNEVTIPAGESAAVEVKIVPPTMNGDGTWPIYSGWVQIQPKVQRSDCTPSEKLQPVLVPYIGMKGDYKSAPALLVNNPDDASYAMNVNVPTFTGTAWAAGKPLTAAFSHKITNRTPLRLTLAWAFPTHDTIIDIIPAGQKKPISLKGEKHFLTLDQMARSFEGVAGLNWYGAQTLDDPRNTATVPAGKYTFRVAALRHFGNPNVEADYHVWTSPEMNISY
ncbi:hypothetical protein HDU85_000991 [Gaertneriomyces sp. JEL0708]|nr:hypothetical protein HDU85_000991 [Gaertneriomyces sp. JEL0708]